MTTDVKKFIRFCESVFGKRVLEKEVEYIYQELNNCERILDIGCGIGSFEQRLSSLNITGLDSSKEMLEEARKKSRKSFVLGDAENLDFPALLFDAVFYVTTLEFVDNYQKAIQEASRITKPNGKFLIMMLNPESEYFHEHIQREGSYFRKVRHTNLQEIREYISRFYHIVKEEYFLGIKKREIFNSSDKRFAALCVIVGRKKKS